MCSLIFFYGYNDFKSRFSKSRLDISGGQLIVLYDRRRVGKTETLREFCKHKPHIFYSCTQSTDRVQLAKFSKQILREDIPAKQYISEFADWEKAFRSILDLPYKEKKKIRYLHMPYLAVFRTISISLPLTLTLQKTLNEIFTQRNSNL